MIEPTLLQATQGDVALVATSPSDASPRRETAANTPLSRGQVVGRYVVLGRLGAGGMGVVYAAYDPELDRKVALKLLLPGHGDAASSSDGRARLLREAQAMARLSHPNVATVHDVGTLHERVFVAMEFVDGQTLGAWRKTAPRTWREVVRVMSDAGRGLAAAHAAGLLHRDFKPDNVMLGRDERPRVMDFGLARAVVGVSPPSVEDTQAQPDVRALELLVTRQGALVGTPAYMSPEQFLGRDVDARADQFAFGVTLWEMLHGERPFRGDSLVELAVNVSSGKMCPIPAGIPVWLRKVVLRSLAVEPRARWPSMEAMLDALAKDPTRTRMRTAAVAFACALGLGTFAWNRIDEAHKVATCESLGASIGAVWGEATREPVHAALVATGSSYAETTWTKLTPRLDAYVAEWQAIRTRVCIASEVDGTQAPEAALLASECLDESRAALETLVERLVDADAQAVQNAVMSAVALPQLDACQDEQGLSVRMALPEDGSTRVAVADLRIRLAEASVLLPAGRYAEGLAEATAIVGEARELDWAPLVATAELAAGAFASHAGDYARAEASERAAYFGALDAAADVVAARAAVRLVDTVGVRLARPADALEWAEHARALLARLERGRHDDSLLEAALANNLGSVHYARGDFDEALALYQRVLAIREDAVGPDHPEVGAALDNIGSVHVARGDYDEAVAHFERVLVIYERTLGPDHPHNAGTLTSLGNVAYSRGAHHDARAHYQRALALYERTLGPDHSETAKCLRNLGLVYLAEGAHDEALEHARRALAIYERAYGEDHPDVASGLNDLGAAYQARGDHDEAVAQHERALAIRERTWGPDHVDVAQSVGNLAVLYEAGGNYEKALAFHERALAIFERTLGRDHLYVAQCLENLGRHHQTRGAYDDAAPYYERALDLYERTRPDHPSVTALLFNLGRTELARGRFTEAVARLERVLATQEKASTATPDLAETRFALARALQETGQDDTRARTLAEQARDAWRDAGAAFATRVVEVERWLTEHG